MAQPISVVVCTYNRADQLRMCLESLSKQDVGIPFEVVVVNGPSTDHTSDVLQEYEARLRVIQQPRLDGAANARNIGLNACVGESVAYIDDDCIANPDWLRILHTKLTTDRKTGCVGGRVADRMGRTVFMNATVDDDGVRTNVLPYEQFYYNKHGHAYNVASGKNMMFTRTLVRDLGGFDEYYKYYYEDADLCVRLIRKGYRVSHEPHATVRHNVTGQHNVSTRYHQSWSEIARSQAYFITRLRERDQGTDAFRTAWGAAIHDIRGFASLMSAGKIDVGTFIKLTRMVANGTMDGYSDGRKSKNTITMSMSPATLDTDTPDVDDEVMGLVKNSVNQNTLPITPLRPVTTMVDPLETDELDVDIAELAYKPTGDEHMGIIAKLRSGLIFRAREWTRKPGRKPRQQEYDQPYDQTQDQDYEPYDLYDPQPQAQVQDQYDDVELDLTGLVK